MEEFPVDNEPATRLSIFPSPAAGHEGIMIGPAQFREADELRLDRLLIQPLRGRAGTYPVDRRDS